MKLTAVVLPGIVLAACSSSVSAPTQATVQAVATSAAPTVQVFATSAASAVQAVATQAAPLVATAAASAPVRITDAQRGTNNVSVVIQGTLSTSVYLSGWKLQVGTATAQLPTGVVDQPGQSITVHTGAGSSSASDIYLGQTGQSLAQAFQPGAQLILQSPTGGPIMVMVHGA